MWHCRRPRCFVVHTGVAQLILVCAHVYIPQDNNRPVTLALNSLWTMEVNKFHSLIHFEASHYDQCDSRLYPGVCMDPINFLDTLMKAFALSMSQVDQIDCVTGILLSIQYQILFFKHVPMLVLQFRLLTHYCQFTDTAACLYKI